MYNISREKSSVELRPGHAGPASGCSCQVAGWPRWWLGEAGHVQPRSEGSRDLVRLLGLEANLWDSAGDGLDDVGGLGGGDEGGG